MTWRTLFRLGVAASALFGLTPAPAYAAADPPPKVVQVSSDPFTNSSSQHQTEVEAHTVTAGSTVVAVFQAGRFLADGGSSGIGFATSQNAGSTWTSGLLPGITIYDTPAGVFSRATDVTAAFDAKHGVWLTSTLACLPTTGCFASNSVLVSRSTSGGTTWSMPTVVFSGGFLDHPWIACDHTPTSPHYGRCYVSINDYATSTDETVRTDDGGLTWSAGVASTLLFANQNVVQPNGDLVIVGGTVAVRSIDGGLTFGAPVILANLHVHAVVGMRVDFGITNVQVDAAGTLYVYWADCRFRSGCSANDIVYSTSSDALTWSSVKRIPLDKVTSGVDHFIPGLGIEAGTGGASAHLALTYYFFPKAACTFPTPDTCRLEVGFSESTDGGATWSKPRKLNHRAMDIAWLANTTPAGHMVGDYLSTAFTNGHTVTVLAMASKPVGSLLQEAMFAAVT